jgi:hypothetical protein
VLEVQRAGARGELLQLRLHPVRGYGLSAEQTGEKACRWFVLVALAAVTPGDAAHDLVDVLTAAGPRGLAALLAGDGTTHSESPWSLVGFRFLRQA